ncbi:putative reverse transcriptase domain, PPM-type phosphatase domain, protein phosphatase 2C family protein [Tanacetum coccineum]
MLQCALSSKEEKSSWLQAVLSTTSISSPARSVNKRINYFNPPPCAVSPDSVAVVAQRAVDPAGSPSSTTIDQDVPSASTSPTN